LEEIMSKNIEDRSVKMDDVTEVKHVKTAEEREAEFLLEREAEILKKYKNVTPDTIRREVDGHHVGKLTVEITCKNKKRPEGGGDLFECGQTRRVATSDLFQVKLCTDCIAEARAAKRRRKAKMARAAKRKETEAAPVVATKPVKETKVKEPKPAKTPAPKKERTPKVVKEPAPKKERTPKRAPKKGMRSVEEIAAQDKLKTVNVEINPPDILEEHMDTDHGDHVHEDNFDTVS
jgi:hypothetical protein